MAVDAAPSARPGASTAPVRGRGRPDLVTIRRTTLIAGLLEGMANAQDGISAAEQIQTAVAAGQLTLAAHVAGRLGYRSTRSLNELRRLVADVEEPA